MLTAKQTPEYNYFDVLIIACIFISCASLLIYYGNCFNPAVFDTDT